jgi:hypothetical protein
VQGRPALALPADESSVIAHAQVLVQEDVGVKKEGRFATFHAPLTWRNTSSRLMVAAPGTCVGREWSNAKIQKVLPNKGVGMQYQKERRIFFFSSKHGTLLQL